MHHMNYANSTIMSLHDIMTELNKRGVTCESIAKRAGIDAHTLRNIRLGRCVSTHMETALRIAQALNRNLGSIDWGRVSLTAIGGTQPGQSHASPCSSGSRPIRICGGCRIELPSSGICSYC